jgi:myo-inositol-1(or 4)-monophosphatase
VTAPEGRCEAALLKATEEVRTKVQTVARKGDSGKTVGVGAAGDKTLVADRAAEEILLEAIGKFEGVRVLSEEAGSVGDRNAGVLAVVDPLDGSSNFERGIQFYCSSVALARGDKLDDVFLGVIRDLVTGDVFVARKGQGATKNGKRIGTSGALRISEAVVGVDLSRGGAKIVGNLAPLVAAAKRQVHFGANALEVCLVADGRTDAFVDLRKRLRVTDAAAAYLIAKEAGATVTDGDGSVLDVGLDISTRLNMVVSAGPALHKEILELCGEALGRGRS